MKYSSIIKNVNEVFGYPDSSLGKTGATASFKMEGGKAFSAGESGKHLSSPVPREVVDSTLQPVYKSLEQTGIVDMSSIQPMGSTLYKSKPELGDLDLLIKPVRAYQNLSDFKGELMAHLYTRYAIRDLAEKGRDFLADEFTVLVPQYDANGQFLDKMAQCDLMLAIDQEDYDWKIVYYSSPKVSAYKALLKNYVIGVYCKMKGYTWTKESGLIKDGKVVTHNADEAVKILFGDEYDVSAVQSVESILSLVEPQYKDELVRRLNDKIKEYQLAGDVVTKTLTPEEQQQVTQSLPIRLA